MIVQSELRLSAQRAFLGRIHAEMRLVKIKSAGREIILTVVLGTAPSAQVREDVSLAAAEIIADFPNADRIEEHLTVTDAPLMREDIRAEGWIYQRSEPTKDSRTT